MSRRIKALKNLINVIYNLNLKKEADMISELFFIKNAFINNAKIKISVSAYNISADLIGDLQSGNSVSFGRCYALNLSDKMIINSSPGTSAWEFHRNMKSAYQGLGYMNDLLTSVISQVQNNGGIAFNGIGSDSVGSMVSEDAMNHTLNKLGKNLVKTPVIVIFKPSSDLFYIFEAEEKEDIISMIKEEYGIELSEEKISMVMELFSTPYKSLNTSLLTGIRSRYIDYIHSAFKITTTSDITSIPKSISYPDDGAREEDSEYSLLIKKRSEINDGLRNLFHEYRIFLKKIFGSIINEDLDLYQEFVDYFYNNIQELPSDDYVRSIAGEVAVESYDHEKDAIRSFKDRSLEILMAAKDFDKELDKFDKKMKDIRLESIDRDNYVLGIRGKK